MIEDPLAGAEREGVLPGPQRRPGREAQGPAAGHGILGRRRRLDGLPGRLPRAGRVPGGGRLEGLDPPAEGPVLRDGGGAGGHEGHAPRVEHGAVGKEREAGAEDRGLDGGGGRLGARAPGAGEGDLGLDPGDGLGGGLGEAAGEGEGGEGPEGVLRLRALGAGRRQAEGREGQGLEEDQHRQRGGDARVLRHPVPPIPHEP